jgi:hypothetical protein
VGGAWRLNGRFLCDAATEAPDHDTEDLVRAYRQRPASLRPASHLLLQHSLARSAHVEHELILGENNLLPFDFLRTGDRLGRAVVKILRGDGAAGTGFLVAPDILLTNHHVLPDPETAAAATAIANHEVTPAPDPTGRFCVVPLHPADLFVTNEELDFTFCGVRGLDYLGTITLDRNGLNVLISEYVNIIQHPQGRPKQVALQDNQVVAVDPVVVRYSCDTEPGSSGSPVFNNQWRLVALHHASVATGPGEGGRPSRGADPSLRYLNEGIRLSAISLWLDSEHSRSGAMRDQLGRLRGVFRGLDPRAGLFGGLGRGGRGRAAAQLVVESYGRTEECLDLAYWDLTTLEQHPSWDRLDSIAWLMTDLGMDLWCLAGLGMETAQRLCGHLKDRFHLGFVARALSEGCAADSPMTVLYRVENGWLPDPGHFSGLPVFGGREGPRRLRVRSTRDPSIAIDLVLGTPSLPIPGLMGGAWGSSFGRSPSTFGAGLRAAAWIDGTVGQAREPAATSLAAEAADIVLLGPGVPATFDGLAELRRAGLTPGAAALGRDGGFILVSGTLSRVSQVFLSSQFISVLGRGAELVVAADWSLPPEARSLSPFEPLAARLVIGGPGSREGARTEETETASRADASSLANVTDMISEIIEPIVSRMIARLREDGVTEGSEG